MTPSSKAEILLTRRAIVFSISFIFVNNLFTIILLITIKSDEARTPENVIDNDTMELS